MGITLNPLLFSGLQKVTKPAGNSFFGNAVNTVGDLPLTGVDGEIRVVKDTNSLYMYDVPTSSWKLLTDLTTDLKLLSFTGTETITFVDIPSFVFASTVNNFSALIEVEKGSQKETFTLVATKTSSGVDKYTQAIGDITSLDLNVIVDGLNQLQVQYKTDATAATYKITFRAITTI